MKWITEISKIPDLPGMDIETCYASFGSCFANHLHDHLQTLKISGFYNPFGIAYDPLSLLRQLSFIEDSTVIDIHDTILKEDYYVHLDFHSECDRSSQNEFIDTIQNRSQHARSSLKKSDMAIITLGSAWIFKDVKQDRPVANCHGLPSSRFIREIISYPELRNALKKIVETLRRFNKEMHVIFTVSPVRHIRYGVIDNSRSKSVLIAGIHEILNEMNDVFYFPAYEILLDELRDYRFYKADLIHPTDQAVQYVMEYWEQWTFSSELKQYTKELNKLHAAIAHKPRQEQSIFYVRHLDFCNKKLSELRSRYPDLDWSKEQEVLRNAAG